MRAKCRALGGLLTSDLIRRRSPMSRSGSDVGLRRILNCCAFLRNPSRTEQGKLSSARGSCCGVFSDGSRFWRCVGSVLAARTSRGAGETPRELRFSRSSRRVCACEGDRPCRHDKVVIGFPIATGGASALVTLMEHVAHEVGMFYVVNVLCVVLVGLHSCLTCPCGAAVGPFVRDCETERLFLCCVVRVRYWPDQPVVRSRVVASFFPTRALPQVVICERRLTSVVFVSNGSLVLVVSGDSLVVWYLVVAGVVEELCSVKIVWCDLPLVVFSPFSGLTVGSACEEVVADLYHHQ
ncbi:hypothetical protein Taro_055647 [Colocasia esculenta]|uniref:Uncharacterized protein n=1 Tax=Colocasia esculenta TaxID=4460 RepID=A0A843XU17_COLES|nr:hypothetical protein [Colocasia esculenta]